jgi:hypothetical protein
LAALFEPVFHVAADQLKRRFSLCTREFGDAPRNGLRRADGDLDGFARQFVSAAPVCGLPAGGGAVDGAVTSINQSTQAIFAIALGEPLAIASTSELRSTRF